MIGSANVGGDTAISTDELFRALGAKPRRVVLFHLQQNGAATMRELTDVVVDMTDLDQEVGATGALGRRRIRTALDATHLPLLERYGLVTYDRIRDIVEATTAPDDLAAWLDLAISHELRGAKPNAQRSDADTVTVLVVDDDPDMVDLLAHILGEQHDDIEVQTATSAPDAFSVLNGTGIDCVVSDYWMPAIDGIDLLRAIREEFPALPFILFTNKGSEEVASQAIANDVTAYVPKGTGNEQYERLVQQIRLAVSRDR
ncbi:response regulator [Halorarius litoreus]|uniref:response regulator n=1 Tax=Halorarius litoreus TaxID=2962676 RepID=UPI0020CCAB4E|nr:response regulator [Halorarius litoreus]